MRLMKILHCPRIAAHNTSINGIPDLTNTILAESTKTVIARIRVNKLSTLDAYHNNTILLIVYAAILQMMSADAAHVSPHGTTHKEHHEDKYDDDYSRE